ncbi:MAG TPA: ATP-binding protein [Patescibacteria group bacterium]|jgi:signal transduction histidine kinase|nr:ATP-binding protein [Patescibacteria group bacterium]
MIILSILIADFMLLGGVSIFYFRRRMQERAAMAGVTNRSQEVQQRMYQIQVLQEINERIGYTLDTSKIIEIVTGSIGYLLEYETVSFMLYSDPKNVVFKCHVHNSVNHAFIAQVKEKMNAATSTLCNQEVTLEKIDERMSGAILDDNLDVQVMSYLNVPVIIEGQLLGLINVSSSKPNLFGRSQAGVVYTITNQAAFAVSKLQEVLENEKGKLSGIIAAMTDGVFMVDLDYVLVISNPAVIDMLQLPVGKEATTFDIIDSLAGKVDLRTKIDEALAKNIPIDVPEVYLHDKVMNITLTPVRDKGGDHRGVAVILHDVTSEKSLEKLRQEFTAMMVHELRAPLTAVRWSSEGLLKSLGDAKTHLEDAKIKDSMTTIDLAATNMLELVNDLLDVAKIEAGKFDLNAQENDIVASLKEAIKTFEPQATAKHLVLNYVGPEKQLAKFDRVRISQVITNLLSNAVKYTDSGNVDLNVTMQEKEKRVVVSIKDSGIGVSREDLSVLFSKFKQLKSFDSSRKGTGLGLVVSKGIVEAHGGQIWAESAGENLGSTFFFSLPL